MVLIETAIKSVLKYLSRTRAGDRDSKWSVHYSTQKPQQGLIFVPEKKWSGNAEDLQACNGLTQHGPRGSHFHHPSSTSFPSLSGLDRLESSACSGWKNKSRKMSSVSSDEDERVILNNKRPLTPLVLNPVHLTSHLDVLAPSYEPTVNVEIESISRLPTPEEKMRQLSKAVGADVVLINITGESFDRQASFRRTSADSLSRRPCNLTRQNTLTEKPDVSQNLESPVVLSDQFSTVEEPVSSNYQQKNREKELGEWERVEIGNEKQPSAMGIRAPRGQEMSALMCSLTFSPHADLPQENSPSLEVQSITCSTTTSSLNSQSSYAETSYGTHFVSSSCQPQDLGFQSDLLPLLSIDSKARVINQSPFSSSTSLASSPVTSSLHSTPIHSLQSEDHSDYLSDMPLNDAAQLHSSTSPAHYLSSSSIANSEPQVLDQTQNNNQSWHYGSSTCQKMWAYQPLYPRSGLPQSGVDHNNIIQDTKNVSGEDWNYDPLLSSGRSSPAFSESTSLCSEKITSSLLLQGEKEKLSTSSYSYKIIRSISLRKSKRPPPPPLRSDSLRHWQGKKHSYSSSSLHLERRRQFEHKAQQIVYSSSQTFDDPWVPRNNNKRRQSGLNCGTVTTFEPLSTEYEGATEVALPVSEHLQQKLGHSYAHVFPQASPGSGSEEAMRINLNSQSASVNGVQRLASPSSGYSSQSNTPTPGTPLSSPLTPSSPLSSCSGAFQPTPLSPTYTHPLSISLPRMKSRSEGRPKPPVPERKSSLFSSLSSSFSSTSSLSSCTSLDHRVLPAPPQPPPLPSFPVTSVFYSPVRESPPAAPSLLHSCLPVHSSISKFSSPSPPLPTSLPLTPPPRTIPPPPPLPPYLTTPPPLPSSFRAPPPPYSYAIRQASLHASASTLSLSTVFSPSPSPPSPLSSLPSLSTSLVSSLSSQCLTKSTNPSVRLDTSPLVTTQALQGVKLRSIKNQEDEPASIRLANDTLAANVTFRSPADDNYADTCHNQPSKEAQINSMLASANVDGLANTEATLAGLQSQNAVLNFGSNEGVSDDSKPAKQYAFKLDYENYNLTKSQMTTCLHNPQGIISSPGNQIISCYQTTDGKILKNIQSNENERKETNIYALLTKYQISSPDSTLVKLVVGDDQNYINTVTQNSTLHQQPVTQNMLTDAMLTKSAEKHGGTKDGSLCWDLLTNEVPHQHCKATLLKKKDEVESNYKNKSEMNNQGPADRNHVSYSDVTQIDTAFKSACSSKLHSLDKPVLPKKPDLCIWGLMASSEVNRSPGGSPQRQQSTILHKKSEHLFTSARKTKPLFISKNTKEEPSSTSLTCGTIEMTGTFHDHNTEATSNNEIMNIIDSKKAFTGIITTLKNCSNSDVCCTTKSPLGAMDNNMWICHPSDVIGDTLDWSINRATCTTDRTMSTLETCDMSRTWQTLGNLQDYRITSAQMDGTRSRAMECCTLACTHKDEPQTFYKKIVTSSLDEKVEQRPVKTSVMMMSSTKKTSKARKRRKKRRGRQLLMMSSTTEPSPSSSSSSSLSSSSSSASSGDERDVLNGITIPSFRRLRMAKEESDEETRNSENSYAYIGQSTYSASSALDSLQGELSIPDLIIQETEKEEEQSTDEEAQKNEVKAKETRGPSDDPFVSVSADQMFVSSQPRTTEDLFAVIHRSKRKMLGRKESEEERHCLTSSCSSVRPVTPAVPGSLATRPVAFKAPRVLRSESFKALLLRKGSQSNSCSRISAVERLCKVVTPNTNHQIVQSLMFPQEHTQVRPSSLLNTLDRQDINAPLPVSPISLYSQNLSLVLGLKQRDLMRSHLFFFPSSKCRSLTPPCSTSRRFAARCRLVSAPMTAIFEGDCEEEEAEEDNDEVSIELLEIK